MKECCCFLWLFWEQFVLGGKNVNISLFILGLYLIVSTFTVSKWVSPEFVFCFTILNLLGFILIILYSKQFPDFSEGSFLKNFLFKSFFVISGVLAGVLGVIGGGITEQIFSEDIFDLDIWYEYLVILSFTGVILLHAVLHKRKTWK